MTLPKDRNMNAIHQMQEIGLAMVGLVFLWAAVSKLASREDFKLTLWSIPRLPVIFVPAITMILPAVEIGIGIGLMLCLDFAKWAAIALLLLFCLLAAVVLRAKLKVPCNCFGSGDRLFSVWTIAQNLGFVVLICIGIPIQHGQEVSFNILDGALILVVGLSLLTILNNRKTIGELRRLNII
jgi:hypothetical protein